MKNAIYIVLLYTIMIVISGCDKEEHAKEKSLAATVTEPRGPNCLAGGLKYISGIDLNNNDSLDSYEIQFTEYYCNSTDDLDSLINVIPEPAGSNCTYGGQLITSGIDSNINGSLEENEIRYTELICFKKDSKTSLEFYLLRNYQTYDSKKILENTVVIADSALIKYDNIISYNPITYSFRISDSLITDSKDLGSLIQKAFAVTIDKRIIYSGYFWSGYLSNFVDWVVIDLLTYELNNELIVELGYGPIADGDSIPDNRNDERIIELLRKDNKIIE